MGIRALGPLAAGLALIALFAFFLWDHAGGERPLPQGTRPPGRPPPPLSTLVSVEARTDPMFQQMERRKPGPPPGEGLERWNIEKMPEGWDPELAGRLARFFEDMDVTDPERGDKIENLDATREQLRAFLASLGPEAIPTLSAVLSVETDFVNRRFLIYALGDLGPRSEEATFALADFYESTRGTPGARSETNHVIKAMGSLKNETSFQFIGDYIDNPDTSSYDRDKLIQVLGEHPRRDEAIPRFVAGMRDERDVNTRNHSAQALGKIRQPRTLAELISSFEREEVWYVRQTILGSIGKIGDPSALPFLEKQARIAEPSGVRLSAANAIRLIGMAEPWREKARRILQSLLGVERDASVRESIIGWLEAWKEK